jgi:hypothetical protein
LTDAAEQLMTALISKMEEMDSNLNQLQKENVAIKQLLNNPAGILKKAGFVAMSTPLAEDTLPDALRGDSIMKTGEFDIDVPSTTEDFHNTSWDDIHNLAESAREVGNVDAPFTVVPAKAMGENVPEGIYTE